eukprot:GHVQ01009959.1.p1 GENE.GHVQ01009959.1~~GHVQ01009959.1.p1  ORF type:complete len:180 (-),score=13.04 GHVQ01009959.1:783-1322(-)
MGGLDISKDIRMEENSSLGDDPDYLLVDCFDKLSTILPTRNSIGGIAARFTPLCSFRAATKMALEKLPPILPHVFKGALALSLFLPRWKVGGTGSFPGGVDQRLRLFKSTVESVWKKIDWSKRSNPTIMQRIFTQAARAKKQVQGVLYKSHKWSKLCVFGSVIVYVCDWLNDCVYIIHV